MSSSPVPAPHLLTSAALAGPSPVRVSISVQYFWMYFSLAAACASSFLLSLQARFPALFVGNMSSNRACETGVQSLQSYPIRSYRGYRRRLEVGSLAS